MGNIIPSILYRRNVTEALIALLNYVMFYGIFAGGTVFPWVEWLYIRQFESKRQKRSKERQLEDESKAVVDWENPGVTGRNRRKAHAPLKAFSSKEDALKYWVRGGGWTHSGILFVCKVLESVSKATSWYRAMYGVSIYIHNIIYKYSKSVF